MTKKPAGRPLNPKTKEVFELFRKFWRDKTEPGAVGMAGYIKMKDFYDFLHSHYKCTKPRKYLFKELVFLTSALITFRRRMIIDEYTGDGDLGDLDVRYGRPCGTLEE